MVFGNAALRPDTSGCGRLPADLGNDRGLAQLTTQRWQCKAPSLCVLPLPLSDMDAPVRCGFLDKLVGMPVVAVSPGKYYAMKEGRI